MEQDGKTRVRCQSCGKRLKYSGNAAGKIFRCPACGGAVVGALELSEAEEAEAAETPKAEDAPRGTATAPEPDGLPGKWRPGGFVARRNEAVVKMTEFLRRDAERVGEEAVSILAERIGDRQKTGRLREVRRRALARRRQLADQLLADMQKEAGMSPQDPQAQSGKVEPRVAAKLQEMREFQFYLQQALGLKRTPDA